LHTSSKIQRMWAILPMSDGDSQKPKFEFHTISLT
jgi:hypothetical protein